MARVTLFGYSPAPGFLHRRHPLFKLLSLVVLSAAVFQSGLFSAAAALPVLLLLFPLCRVGWDRLRPALGFLGFTAVLLVASLFLSGDIRQNLAFRLLDLLRLADALFLGILFTSVTPPSGIRNALSLLFRPLPRRLADSAVLLVTFVFMLLPLTFAVLEQTRLAQELRSAGRIRHPVRRLRLLAVPFMAQLFLKTDRMGDAAALRCGPGRYRPPGIPLTAGDFLLFTGAGVLFRLLLP